jgi:hypothetical protein
LSDIVNISDIGRLTVGIFAKICCKVAAGIDAKGRNLSANAFIGRPIGELCFNLIKEQGKVAKELVRQIGKELVLAKSSFIMEVNDAKGEDLLVKLR